MVQQVAPLTEQVCFHLMGDPLVHPQLEKLIDICAEFQVRIFFVTNGVLLNETKSELLLHPVFRQVNFSLHSFFDNYPERDPSIYLERVFSYTRKAMQQRPDLYINYRLWNLQDPKGVGERNHDLLERIFRHFEISSALKVSADRKIDVRSWKSVLLSGRVYLHFDTEFIWPSLALPVLGTWGTCYGLTSHFGVLVDGTVVPCCLDKEGSIPLGNIQNQDIEEILGSARAQAILDGFRKRRLVESLCQRCQYIERFTE